jgi:uncharacterized membrane protein
VIIDDRAQTAARTQARAAAASKRCAATSDPTSRRDEVTQPAGETAMSPIGLIVALIVVLLVAGAFLAVVRAILSLPPFASFAPYSNVIYALIVLLVVLICVSYFWGGFGETGPFLHYR